jgi:hypothetical protein
MQADRLPGLPQLVRWILLPSLHRIFSFVLLWFFLVPAAPIWANPPLQEQNERFFSLSPGGTLTVNNTDGAIHVYAWNESRVRLAWVRKAYTTARLHQIRVTTRSQPNALFLQTNIPKATGFFADRSGTVEYTLTVPMRTNLTLKLNNGDITLSGLRGGQIGIELVNGWVSAGNCYAQIQARSVQGVMEIFYDWWEDLPAQLQFFLQRGRIMARLPINARFQVNAQAPNGQVNAGFPSFAATTNGSGQKLEGATAPNPSVSLGLRAAGGNITIDAIR